MRAFLLLLVALIGGCSAEQVHVAPNPTDAGPVEVAAVDVPAESGGELVQVVRVIDGDTIVIEGGERVRLLCVDTPERGQPGWAEARDFLRELVEGRAVRLVREDGHRNRDRYGRLLRLVYVGDELVQALIITAGHSVYEPRWGACPTVEAAIRR